MNIFNNQTGKMSPVYLYWVAIVIVSLILFYRLFYLQILHQSEYSLQSDQNRIREVTLQPLRGLIYDRAGKLLVNDYPAFTLYAIPYYLRRNPQIYNKLAAYTGRQTEVLQKIVRRDMLGYFKPVRLLRQVDFKVVSRFEENRMDFPGVDFWVEPIRSYPTEIKAAHLFGYLGEISPDEMKKNARFQKGDIIGKKGLERYYENILHGKPGVKYVEVDVVGREIKTLQNPKQQAPVPGDQLFLTLDYDLQRRAEQLMEGKRGSIIMMDLRDGGILTMVSKPDYSPEDLSGVISLKVWNRLLHDPDHPMYDRSIQSVYPPGSTYKLVLALAALTNHTITPEWSTTCKGYMRFGRRPFKCWKAGGHGRLNMYQAIEQSCNVYFYRLGLKVGIDEWSKFSRLFHFGQKTGIDLPLEMTGNVPDKNYLDKKYGTGKWTQGLMLNLAVGQGDLLVTPLQMLQFVSIVARKGVLYKPHLMYYHVNPLTGVKTYYQPDSTVIGTVPDTAYQMVRKGMYMVVNGIKGTGKAASVPNVIVAGKSGTAQNPHGKSHAWFIGFAPFDSPKVAIVAFVENGGGGGAVAAPKAGVLFRRFFKRLQENSTRQTIAGKINK
ncbi:MAG TPA: penicillin-binding protein 2 [Bacteroidetes bacterium]|nr:penicillin-binding protein 2 [Bacteroidota bacterium]